MAGAAYSFASDWHVPAALDDTYAVLADPVCYPAWWPQVREAERIDDDRVRMRVRSTLPYDLRFTTTRSAEDARRGLLEARLHGDLDGVSRWRLVADEAGTRVRFEEEVLAVKPLLRLLGPVARPAFRANHATMMRAGERGLRSYVAENRRGDR
jgi:hypothetical protein